MSHSALTSLAERCRHVSFFFIHVLVAGFLDFVFALRSYTCIVQKISIAIESDLTFCLLDGYDSLETELHRSLYWFTGQLQNSLDHFFAGKQGPLEKPGIEDPVYLNKR